MYSTFGLHKNTKRTAKIVGTHQRIDRAARTALGRSLKNNAAFPSAKEILYFEGMRGPDGLKRKSPGIDEPHHFYIPGQDNSEFLTMLSDHQYNLRTALTEKDTVRASFEAAWLAHAVADGLTPAHHFPLHDVAEEMMTDQEFYKIFGEPIKGIMRGNTKLETLKKNWDYWGVDGHMSRHIAFEFGVAAVAASATLREITPKFKKNELKNIDLIAEFEAAASEIVSLDLYTRFADYGWAPSLANDIKNKLLLGATRLIALAWASAIPDGDKR